MTSVKKIKSLVKRRKNTIDRNCASVITRAHIPSDMSRVVKIINRVVHLPDKQAEKVLKEVISNFYDRHKNLEQQLYKHCDKVKEYLPSGRFVSDTKKKLIGAYLTMEYSIESAALFNPSIVMHPDQEGVPDGALRCIMSLRATGEGHLSSIVFRSGVLQEDGNFLFDETSAFVQTPTVLHDPTYDHHLFRLKLEDMNSWDETSYQVFEKLDHVFSYGALKASINDLYHDPEGMPNEQTIKNMNWLADSNYKIKFDEESIISERVIFPVSENESRGIEDARFVQFYDDNGDITYYATYTAYNGVCILPHLLETSDFLSFNIITLNGKAVQNKGMALFPRKINGKYAMLSRWDGENNYIMFSEHLHFWNDAEIIQQPGMPWEFVQIGNCGSPIETSEGWLVLTHGVGPMRQYAIGAILLDLDKPEKVIARLEEPLITPNEKEREGYVPNVVYSCGSLIHNNLLVIPYAMSDLSSNIATVQVQDLIACMKRG